MSNSYWSSEPFSCAAIEQDYTLGLVIQIFSCSYNAGIDVVFPHSCPLGFVPYPVKGLLEVNEDIVEMLLMLQVFLAEDPEIEYLFCGAPTGSETCLLFCNDLFCLWLESVQDDLQHDLTRMADKADGSVVLAQLQVAFLWECNN